MHNQLGKQELKSLLGYLYKNIKLKLLQSQLLLQKKKRETHLALLVAEVFDQFWSWPRLPFYQLLD